MAEALDLNPGSVTKLLQPIDEGGNRMNLMQLYAICHKLKDVSPIDVQMQALMDLGVEDRLREMVKGE